MNADELDVVWRRLRTPVVSGQLEAFAITDDGVWAAVDPDGLRHLLLQVPDGTEAPTVSTRGLQADVSRHQVREREAALYLDLRCLSADVLATFTAVAADITTAVSGVPERERFQETVAALARWQWFWGVEPGRLSELDALGLFAELWFLLRWVGTPRSAIKGWTASSGSRHDFQWPERSVEVKAATRRADGAVLHRIQHLDQLADPEQGRLFLFSLRVVRDQLARNSLPSVVDRITDALRGNLEAGQDFARKLGLRGYSPALRHQYETPYRILGEHLYEVRGAFPRLTSSSFIGGVLPSGVSDVSYMIDMAACDQWLMATSPEQWPPT